jgi:hypothetical protein
MTHVPNLACLLFTCGLQEWFLYYQMAGKSKEYFMT